MKKAIFLRFVVLCFVFLGSQAKAQMYFIPDTNFRAYLQAWFPGCMNATGDSLDGSSPAVFYALDVSVSNSNISTLTGIQAFKNLNKLICNNNQLASLPSLPSSLTRLSCYNNQLTYLPSLPSSLTYLNCENNQLLSLPSLPSALTNLFCRTNQIASLPNFLANVGRSLSENLRWNVLGVATIGVVTTGGFTTGGVTVVAGTFTAGLSITGVTGFFGSCFTIGLLIFCPAKGGSFGSKSIKAIFLALKLAKFALI